MKPAFRLAWAALAISALGVRVGVAAEPAPSATPAAEKEEAAATSEKAPSTKAEEAEPAKGIDQRIAALDARIAKAKSDPSSGSLDHLKALRARLLLLKKLLLEVVKAERSSYDQEERLTQAIAERERARLLGEQMEARRVRAVARLSEVNAELSSKETPPPKEKVKPVPGKKAQP